MKRYLRGIAVLTLALIFISLGLAFVIGRNNKTINTQESYFIIKKGTETKDIAKQLMDKKIIKSSQYFITYSKFKGYSRKMLPGKYIIKPGMGLNDLLKRFASGKSDFAVVTIPEGYTLYQIASKLEDNNLGHKNKFLSLKPEIIDDNGLVNENENTFYSLEGYLFPDTYYIPYDKTQEDIAKLMFKRFEKIYGDKERNRAKELGLTTNQIITIASLIEREAANDLERTRISGVIYNRIKKGMPLQIDAAVIYAVTKGEKNISRLSRKNLGYKSPYNTYTAKGLPPGPIACPGKPSIMAALYPESHDYLYYVLGDNGGHVFSRTYKEHVKNVNKYIK